MFKNVFYVQKVMVEIPFELFATLLSPSPVPPHSSLPFTTPRPPPTLNSHRPHLTPFPLALVDHMLFCLLLFIMRIESRTNDRLNLLVLAFTIRSLFPDGKVW